MDLRHGEVKAVTGFLNGRRHFAHLLVHIQIGIGLDIAYAVAAAQIQLLRHIAVFFLHVGAEFQHELRRALKYVLGKDLRAHMAVEAHQLHMRLLQREGRDLLSLSGFDGGAELAVHLSGGDGFISVRINARRQAQQHLLPYAAAAGLRLNGLDLLHIVGHKIADVVVHTVSNIRIRLVVGVEIGVRQVVSGKNRGIHLAAGHHVNAHSLLTHDLIDPLEGVRLAGIQRAGVPAEMLFERRLIHAAAFADLIFIHYVKGGAVLLSQGHNILTGKQQMALFGNGDVITNTHVFFPFVRFVCPSGTYSSMFSQS